jgi:hypothetical protein
MPLPRPSTPENLLHAVVQLVDALERGVVQLGAPKAGRKLDFGSATLTWPGGSREDHHRSMARREIRGDGVELAVR